MCTSETFLLVTAGSCPKNMRRVDCPLNPCLLVSCPAVKIAQCVVDTCGRCRPRWIYVGREVTNDCLGGQKPKSVSTVSFVSFVSPESLIACPDGSVHHKCPEDPCRTASCPAVDGAVCLADYCGGCKGRWILGDIEVTKKCHQGLASVASLIPGTFNAFYFPTAEIFCCAGRCMGRRCQAPIPAMCIDHGNLHEWRDWNHNDVTHICENSLLASLESELLHFLLPHLFPISPSHADFWCSPPTCHVPEARCDLLDGRPVWQFPPGREVTNWCY